MKTNHSNNATLATIFGILFILAGAVTLIGLMTFANSCDRLLMPAEIPARCDSLNFMQRSLAVVVMAIGALMIGFRRVCAGLKGLQITAFLLGILLIISAVVLTDTCNSRAHTLIRGGDEAVEEFIANPPDSLPDTEEPVLYVTAFVDGESVLRPNMRVHALEVPNPVADPAHPEHDPEAPPMIPDPDGTVTIIWTNFVCNTSPFLTFGAFMGIGIAVLAALFGFFMKKTELTVRPCAKNAGIVFVVLGVFTGIMLGTLTPPCLDFAGANYAPMFMRCYDVAVHMHGIAWITAIAGVLMILFSQAKPLHAALTVVVGLLGAMGLVIRFNAYACTNPDMVCNARPFMPFILIMSGLILLVAVVNVFVLRKQTDTEPGDEEELDEFIGKDEGGHADE